MTTQTAEEEEDEDEAELPLPTTRVLIVCPSARMLEPAFAAAAELPAVVVHAESCLAARACLASEAPPDLIVTAVTLSDGNWEGLHRSIVDHGGRGLLVVAAPSDSTRLESKLLVRGVVRLPLELSRGASEQRLLELWRDAAA